MPHLLSCCCGGSCPDAVLCSAAGADWSLLPENKVNFVPRDSSSTAAMVEVGQL